MSDEQQDEHDFVDNKEKSISTACSDQAHDRDEHDGASQDKQNDGKIAKRSDINDCANFIVDLVDYRTTVPLQYACYNEAKF